MNSLGSNKEQAENKLILLYILDKVHMPVSSLQMIKLILENRFMNYFLLQQFLKELCESGFLSEETMDDKKFYTITPVGRQTLGYFTNLIPPGIKSRIDETIASVKSKIRNETQVVADFIPESENKFVVTCKVKEDDFTLLDLNIAVGSKKDARIICENWNKHAHKIYSEIIDSLTKSRD